MGEDSDAPRPGFDYWAGFRGQGDYTDPTLNVNGERRAFKGYNSDVLPDRAIEWLREKRNAPFFLYLSFKAPHYPFEPAPRHRGRYDKAPVPYPVTMANTERNYATQPRWVRERRYSIHGVDHMETGRFDNDPVPSFEELFRRFAEAVHSTDENVGRVLMRCGARRWGCPPCPRWRRCSRCVRSRCAAGAARRRGSSRRGRSDSPPPRAASRRDRDPRSSRCRR
jgi:N-acetylglucosamine-6-sulfatase